jgi:hypothetical protein
MQSLFKLNFFPLFLFGLLLGAIAVAVALAFGLGGREIAARAFNRNDLVIQKRSWDLCLDPKIISPL